MKKTQGGIYLAYPLPSSFKEQIKALREGRTVSPIDGTVAYRVIRFKPKWRTRKVTFNASYKGGWWLSDKQLAKIECKKSPTGKHEWEEAKEDRTLPRGDWGFIPGEYCKHCEIRKDTGKRLGEH